jgi:MFS family permease
MSLVLGWHEQGLTKIDDLGLLALVVTFVVLILAMCGVISALAAAGLFLCVLVTILAAFTFSVLMAFLAAITLGVLMAFFAAVSLSVLMAFLAAVTLGVLMAFLAAVTLGVLMAFLAAVTLGVLMAFLATIVAAGTLFAVLFDLVGPRMEPRDANDNAVDVTLHDNMRLVLVKVVMPLFENLFALLSAFDIVDSHLDQHGKPPMR